MGTHQVYRVQLSSPKGKETTEDIEDDVQMRHIVTGNTPEWDAAMRIYIAKARARGDYESWFDMPKFNGNFIKEKKQHQQEKDVQMKQIIRLYIWRLEQGFMMEDAEIEQFEELIRLYINSKKERLEKELLLILLF